MGTHVELLHSTKPMNKNFERIGDANPREKVEVILSLDGPEFPEFGTFPERPTTLNEFDARYGARRADSTRVARVLAQHGLKTLGVSLRARTMQMAGTVAAMRRAFCVELATYRSPQQGLFRGREGTISIPKELDGVVTGVFGLDQRRAARRRQGRAAAPSRKPPPGLRPSDLEARYGFPPGDGRGQTIAIGQFGGVYVATDLEAYCKRQGRRMPKVETVAIGAAPLTMAEALRRNAGREAALKNDTGEVMLDVEIIAGLCERAKIVIYFVESPDQRGWMHLMTRVLERNPSKLASLSISWGAPQDAGSLSEAGCREISHRFRMLAHLGVTVCVPSGDDGAGDGVSDGHAHTEF